MLEWIDEIQTGLVFLDTEAKSRHVHRAHNIHLSVSFQPVLAEYPLQNAFIHQSIS
jgi:hypothetical protein